MFIVHICVPQQFRPTPLSLSISHIIPRSSPNDEIFLNLINHTNRKQNANNREDFKQQVKLSLCDCENAHTGNPV